jgi:serine/threonine protein kinase
VDPYDTLIAPARAPHEEPRGRLTGPPRFPEARSTVLGRYLLLERLGAGGFGVVWRAHDELLDREVAVKVIPLPPGEDHERAAREALAAARLAHPAIVALYEASAREDAFYLISELVHGETLAQLIAAEALCDEEVLEIGCALVDALLHAHQRGVIHRDIKPHNVLVPAASTPARGQAAAGSAPAKLTDFGGALLAGEESLTRTGDVLGTLAYMAPEQIEGLEVAEPADLYALALVIYEALSGVNPVRGPTPAATARRIGCALPPLERYRRDLPRALTRAVDLALDPDPDRRGTLLELRAAFAQPLHRDPRRSLWGRRARSSPTAYGRPIQAGPEGPAQSHLPTPSRPLDAFAEELSRGDEAEISEEELDDGGWLTLPRLGWLLAALAVGVWQGVRGRPGIALLALCSILPLVLLVRRPGPRWLTPVLAPALGLVGLAGSFPALAGQSARWRTRALLGALGYWWLRLAELALDGPTRRLWLGLPVGLGGRAYSPSLWEGSLSTAAVHALVPLLSLALVLGAILWAAAAAALPWIVRGRSAMHDALGAILWATVLAAAASLPSLVDPTHAPARGLAAPHGLILGAAVGALFAVGARALRGPV